MQSYQRKLFLTPQYIQFTTNYFDFESKKKLYGNRIVKKLYGNDLPKINKKCAENES